jgi:hypothetical protein
MVWSGVVAYGLVGVRDDHEALQDGHRGGKTNGFSDSQTTIETKATRATNITLSILLFLS